MRKLLVLQCIFIFCVCECGVYILIRVSSSFSKSNVIAKKIREIGEVESQGRCKPKKNCVDAVRGGIREEYVVN